MDWDQTVLKPGEILLLRPRHRLTHNDVTALQGTVPAHLRDRIIVVDPEAFEAMTLTRLDKD